MLDGLAHAVRVRAFWYVLAIAFIGLGIFNGLTTWIEAMLRPRGFSPADAGTLGAVLLVAGLVGAVVLPALSDRQRRRRPFLVLAFVGAIPGLLGVALAGTLPVLLISGAVLGFFLVSALPIGFQYASEVTRPTPEGTSNGLMQLFGQGSVVFVYADVGAADPGRLVHPGDGGRAGDCSWSASSSRRGCRSRRSWPARSTPGRRSPCTEAMVSALTSGQKPPKSPPPPKSNPPPPPKSPPPRSRLRSRRPRRRRRQSRRRRHRRRRRRRRSPGRRRSRSSRARRQVHRVQEQRAHQDVVHHVHARSGVPAPGPRRVLRPGLVVRLRSVLRLDQSCLRVQPVLDPRVAGARTPGRRASRRPPAPTAPRRPTARAAGRRSTAVADWAAARPRGERPAWPGRTDRRPGTARPTAGRRGERQAASASLARSYASSASSKSWPPPGRATRAPACRRSAGPAA